MRVEILPAVVPELYPVTREVGSIRIAGESIADRLLRRFGADASGRRLTVRADFRPSAETVELVRTVDEGLLIRDPLDGTELLRLEPAVGPAGALRELHPDAGSARIRYPWDLLELTGEAVGALDHDEIFGTVRNGVTIDGHIRLGRGSVILPGVYIEGNVAFGDDCRIGPNCYLRGNTSIGDRCHIGQAVEIKNSLLFDRVAIGHLSYAGDSVICDRVNFGAGTIVSNFRHDGANHRWRGGGRGWVDTGRRKFGAVIGEDVHTGIHSAIYPGRMLSPGASTRPGEVVEK